MNYKDIPGYQGYQINEYGEVFSLKSNKVMQPAVTHAGYLRLALSNEGEAKNFFIHQLVAMTFLDHVPNGMQMVVDHIDNNKLNNHIDNLQLVSQRYNSSKDRDRKYDLPTNVYLPKGETTYMVRMKVKDARVIVGRFNTVEEAVEARDYFMQLNDLL